MISGINLVGNVLKFTISVSIIFILGFHSNAQKPQLKFKYLGVNEGLSEGNVECIIQDHEGYLWFGTYYGLNKYNGYDFTVYKNDYNDANSISSNNIVCLYEDRENNLWIGTLDGLNKYDRKHDKFISFKHDSKNKRSISQNGIRAIHEDSAGNLWVSTVNWSTDEGKLNVYNKKNGFSTYGSDVLTGIGSNIVNCFFEESNGNLWLGLNNGLSYYDTKKKTFTTYLHNDGASDKSINGEKVNSIIEDYKGNLWIATQEGGISVLNRSLKKFKHYTHNDNDTGSLGSNEIYTLLADKSNRIWIGGGNGGLQLYNPLEDNFIHYQSIEKDFTSISNNSIEAILEDKTGLIWVGVHSNGINYFSTQKENFKHYNKELKAGSLSNNNVKAFCEDSQGGIWIGTDGGGLNKFDKKRNSFSYYKHTKDHMSIGSNAILDIFEDSYNNLWISTWGGGLNLLDRKTNTFKHYYHNTNDVSSISSNDVCSTLEDLTGNLWIASYQDGLNLYNRNKNDFTRIPCIINNEKSRVSCMAIGIDGLMWIGTNSSGIGIFDPVKKKMIQAFHYNKNVKNSISSNGIYSLCIDSKNRIWIGTDKGINLYNAATKSFNTWRQANGLTSDVILGIEEDNKNNLWLSTLNGISKFNPDLNTYSGFSITDGLQGTDFVENSSMKTKSGEIFFGGLNGFNIFHPDSLKKNNFIPNVHFTDFQIFNKSIKVGAKNSPLKNHISQTSEIVLSYKQSVISFEFAALNYINAKKNQYAYKLEGFDDDWNYIGTKRSVTYTNLDAGEYILKVKASNNDGLWNEEGTSLKLIITPPFWQTWWAYIIYCILIVFVLYVFRKFSIIHIKDMNKLVMERLESRKIKEIVESKMRFFTNISHEIRTPLTLISSPLESVLTENDLTPNDRKNLLYASKNVKRLLNLANQILQFRKLDQAYLHLNAAETPVVSFIKEILEYFEPQAMLKNITISIDNHIGEDVNLWLDREMITTVFYNLLANALKFTESGGTVTIHIFEDTISKAEILVKIKKLFSPKAFMNNGIAIEINDTGKGIPAKALKNIFKRFYQVNQNSSDLSSSGIGLSLVKEYIELHKGQIKVRSKLLEGTSFTIYFPYDLKIEKTNAEHINKFNDLPKITNEINHEYKNKGVERALILIVEDDLELTDHLSDLLLKSFTVEVAHNGKIGFEKALKILPDLIISDIAMPEMDGYTLCKDLKSNIITSHIPIILLTAKADDDSIVLGYDVGADAYIPKPFNINMVLSQGKSLIKSRKILKEKYKNMTLIEPSDIIVESPDEKFLKQMMTFIEANIKNSNLDVSAIAVEIGMSYSTLLRKVKSLTGLSVVDLIKTTRLKRAAMILKKEKHMIADVCYMVGFTDPRYFSKCFIKEFGKTPSEFLSEYSNKE